MNEMREVELLFPKGKDVSLKGKTYHVKPFGFGQFPIILKMMDGFSAENLKEQGNTAETLFMLIKDNAAGIIEICALAVGEKKEFFLDLPPDEGLTLIQAILEVNVDFFTKRLLPILTGMFEKLTESVGAASLPSSSKTVTP